MRSVNVKNIVGEKVEAVDGIILRSNIKSILEDEVIELDFDGVEGIDCSFLSTLFNDLIYYYGRNHIIEHIKVKNLLDKESYNRIVLGTTFSIH